MAEVSEFLDIQNYEDRKAMAKASECIQLILRGKRPDQWHGANVAFIQKIVDFASDKRATLKDKFDVLMEYAISHSEIAKQNIERKVTEKSLLPQPADPNALAGGATGAPAPAVAQGNENMSAGMSRALNMAEAV